MSYIENPKTKGSGIICAIPQTGTCPMKCDDCLFQSGRSYLEPLDKNLPNVPTPEMARGRVVRMNDGNDSNVERDMVIECGEQFEHVFYNTAIRCDFDVFDAPVVFTLNPGSCKDLTFCRLNYVPENLMFVRFIANTWNIPLARDAYEYYSERGVPLVLTFMAYHDDESIPAEYSQYYDYKKRTLNEYYAINRDGWEFVVDSVSECDGLSTMLMTCGISSNVHACRYCGNCLREYFATRERMLIHEEDQDKETRPRW